MAYVKTTWVDDVTPLSAANFNKIEDALEAVLLNVYPVGSIYMSVNNTNPSTLFGGTWVAWGAGRVPVGVDTTKPAFDTVEETGGSATHTHTNPTTGSHTLTVDEMPAHSHNVNAYYYNNDPQALTHFAVQSGSALDTGEIVSESVGGGQGHTHTMGDTGSASTLQPYITCYMWKRTA